MTLSKDALLGASDLVERDVELPSIGGTVRVRSLPAAYSNQAQSEALEVTTVRGEQLARVNVAKLEALQVLHGLIDPKLESLKESEALARTLGSSWRRIVTAIDEISGIDKEAVERANAMFQPGGQSGTQPPAGNGASAGDGGSDLPVLPGTGDGTPRRGDV